MADSADHVAEQLFKIIKGFGHTIILFTDDGKKTTDPTESRRFYAKDIKMMVNLVVDTTTNEIIVNLSNDTDIKTVKPMLASIRNLANQHIIEYTVKTFGKSIEPRDFSYQAKQIGESTMTPDEISRMKKSIADSKAKLHLMSPAAASQARRMHLYYQDKIDAAEKAMNEGFSGWKGSARKSVNELNNTRIIIRHTRNVDEERRGARTRQIESIFIENVEGERFKFPNNNITAAKAMARHVQEGGTPFDDFGQHIYGVMEEIGQLKKFQRNNKKNDFFEDAAIGEEITSHIGSLRKNLHQMAGLKGYKAQFESFTKESSEVSPEKLDELKDNVTVRYFDENISESLPYVARIIEALRDRQASESHIVEFARQVMNNTTGFTLSESCDDDDPEGPAARIYKDQVSEVAAWAAYLSPKVQNEELSTAMTQLEENLSAVSSKHVSMAAAAINVIRQQSTVAEPTHIAEKKVNRKKAEIEKINESFKKYDIRKIFDV